MDEIIFAKVFALKVEADSINAEIEMMKLINTLRPKGSYPAYSKREFNMKVGQLRGIASDLQALGRG